MTKGSQGDGNVGEEDEAGEENDPLAIWGRIEDGVHRSAGWMLALLGLSVLMCGAYTM